MKNPQATVHKYETRAQHRVEERTRGWEGQPLLKGRKRSLKERKERKNTRTSHETRERKEIKQRPTTIVAQVIYTPYRSLRLNDEAVSDVAAASELSINDSHPEPCHQCAWTCASAHISMAHFANTQPAKIELDPKIVVDGAIVPAHGDPCSWRPGAANAETIRVARHGDCKARFAARFERRRCNRGM